MAERTIRIAQDVALPLEAVTETFAILAKRGVGKTYTGAVLAEEMVGAGAQVVILDPLDAWWGLRSSADGTGDGLPIYVFGGEHGDLPLEATAGELLADVVVDHGISAIFSLRHMAKGKQRAFVTAFAERLYHRKGEPEHRTPLHVFIDEADAFVPQRVAGDTARMVGAIDDLSRRGRNAGLGVTLISQRAAVVNKDVLTQAEVLIAMRTISPQDRKALDAWVEAHDAHDQRGAFMESLASLAVGEAWVWSPGWLDIFQRVRIRARRTFDSSATPKAGARAVQPKQRADVDLEQLGERIAATIETSKANDPKELRRRIAELEREAAKAVTTAPEPVVERVEVPVLNGQVERLGQIVDGIIVYGDKLRDVAEILDNRGAALVAVGQQIVGAIERVSSAPAAVQERPRHIPREAPQRPVAAASAPPSVDVDAKPLKAGARRMLQALAMLHPEPLTRQQMATLADISPTSGTFTDYLSAIRTGGYIEELAGGRLALSAAGQELVAGDLGSGAPTVDDLVVMWGRRLKAGARRMLDVLVEAYPEGVTRAELGERAEISSTSGTFTDYLSALRRVGLLDETQGDLRAGPALFIGGGHR